MATLASLLVELGIDTSDFTSGVDQVTEKSNGLGNLISGAFNKIGGIGNTLMGFTAVVGTMASAAGGLFDMNAMLETTELQFTTLMGSSDAAKQHVSDLFAFAKKTPFETQPIINASKAMLTFGGAALDTTENMTLIGDASAATSAPIDELGLNVGRLYNALQSGKPFGDSIGRLQELGVVSPKTAAAMEKLQAAGGSSAEIFKLLQDDMGHFSGAMEAQAGTWSGLMSSFQDAVSITMAEGLAPLFDLGKKALGVLTSPEVSSAISSLASLMAGVLTGAVQLVVDIFSQFEPLFTAIVGGIQLLVEAFMVGMGPEGDVVGGITNMLYYLGQFSPIFDLIGDAVVTVADVITAFVANAGPIWESFKGMLTGSATAASDFGTLMTTVFGVTLGPIITTFVTSTISVFQSLWDAGVTIFNGIKTAIETVFAGVALFLSEHGTQIQTVLTNAWNFISSAVTTVTGIISSVVQTVFEAVGTFLTAHGDQILLVFTNAWNFISAIVNAAVTTIQTYIVPAFEAIAAFFADHTEAMTAMTQTAWDLISGIISFVLGVINGALESFTALFQGDWDTFWGNIRDGAKVVWQAIQDAWNAALKWISDTATAWWKAIKDGAEVAWKAFKDWWDGLVQSVVDTVTGIGQSLIDAGSALVENIKQGISDAWDGFVGWFKDKLGPIADLLPGSEPKDKSSPLYGLGDRGMALVGNIQTGIDNAPSLTLPEKHTTDLITTFYDQVNAAIASAPKINLVADNLYAEVNKALDAKSPFTIDLTANHLYEEVFKAANKQSAALADKWKLERGGNAGKDPWSAALPDGVNKSTAISGALGEMEPSKTYQVNATYTNPEDPGSIANTLWLVDNMGG